MEQIPKWIIDYDKCNYQSSAGKAVRILLQIIDANNVLATAHSPEREKELQELCKQVLNANPERYYNPNGADETTCPFCYTKDYSNDCTANIEDLKHDVNCAYNIAKGLSTNSR